MNAQEVFDTVKKHLLCQNEVSSSNTKCLYHGPEGLKCAIGALIPDEKYNRSFEHMLLAQVYRAVGFTQTYDFIRELQELHDCNLPGYWKLRLSEFAKKWGLNDQ